MYKSIKCCNFSLPHFFQFVFIRTLAFLFYHELQSMTATEFLEMFQRFPTKDLLIYNFTYTYSLICMFANFRIFTIYTLLNYLSIMLKCKESEMFGWQSTHTLPNVCTHQPKLLSHSLGTVCHIKLKHQEKC